MSPDVFMWILARVAGLTAFAALCITVVTGVALRTSVLDWLASNRALRAVHEFANVLWIPMGLLHVAGLLLDPTARVSLADVVIPFQMPYGAVAAGLGTLSLWLFAVAVISGWLRRGLPGAAWRWAHRLAYPAFVLLFLHAALGGSDFSDPAVSAATWAVAFAIGVLAAARVLWGRLPA